MRKTAFSTLAGYFQHARVRYMRKTAFSTLAGYFQHARDDAAA
jgi:hypothetical protein